MSDKHIQTIEEKVNAVRKIMTDLAAPPAYQELLRIIHNPGWTTPAELAFVLLALDGMAAHAQAIAGMKAGLLKAAVQVKVVSAGKAAA